MKTVNIRVKLWGITAKAYYDRINDLIRVLDPVAGYYTACVTLTSGQIKYIKSRT